MAYGQIIAELGLVRVFKSKLGVLKSRSRQIDWNLDQINGSSINIILKYELELLKIESIVLSLFQLILGVFFKFTPDIIDRNLRIFEAFLKESCKIKLYNQNGTLVTTLILSLFETNKIIKI